MVELPLFPLNSVLFPGLPIRLHIFEPRYKKMINECIESKNPFGVVLIKSGMEAMGPLAEPHLVGCAAEIVQVERLNQGRMNITAVGRNRFRIAELDTSQSYLVGNVEFLPLEGEDNPSLQVEAQRLRPWVVNYLKLLAQAGGIQLDTKHVPKSPSSLAYLAAYLLQIPASGKQEVLEVNVAVELLDTVERLYRREIALLRTMIMEKDESQRGFGLN